MRGGVVGRGYLRRSLGSEGAVTRALEGAGTLAAWETSRGWYLHGSAAQERQARSLLADRPSFAHCPR